MIFNYRIKVKILVKEKENIVGDILIYVRRGIIKNISIYGIIYLFLYCIEVVILCIFICIYILFR